jgi:uncharacterized protein (DUF1778 family)
MTKTTQLQIRVTPAQKARLRQLAGAAGQDVSAYVLGRVLPPEREQFRALLRTLAREDDHRYALAELHDFLAALAPAQFGDAVASGIPEGLSPLLRNYVAAMVEHAAMGKEVSAPSWVHAVEPLEHPHFGAPLRSLRLHLLATSPVAFKRRNIFVDAAVGDRV